MKLNGISTGKSRMAKLLPAKLVRDLWKMEFKDMESTWETWKSTGNGSCVGSVKERRSAKIGSGGT